MTRLSSSRFVSLAFVSFSLLSLVSADAVDFHWYPSGAQDCLYKAQDTANCDGSTVPKFNGCVCGNGGGFLDAAASCLGDSDSGDVDTVYNTMSSNCAGSNTPIKYSLSQWQAKAGSGSSKPSTSPKGETKTTTEQKPPSTQKTTIVVTAAQSTPVVSTVTLATSAGETSASVAVVTVTPGQSTILTVAAPSTAKGAASTTGSSPSATGSNKNGGGGGGNKLGTGAIAGIAVGAAAVAAIAAGVLIWLFLRRRNRPAPADTSYTAPPPTYGAGTADMKEGAGGTYIGPPPAQPTPEPTKYTYANQQTSGQPMYNQPPQSPQQPPQQPSYQAYQPQPAYNQPAPQQGTYMQPHGGAMELQGGSVQAPMELPAGRY